MTKNNPKHKTIGVSLSPTLRQKAGHRARQLGLNFSRYVSLCLEAEAAGRVALAGRRVGSAQAEPKIALPLPDNWQEAAILEDGALAAWGAAPRVAERLRADVATLLERAQLPFVRLASLGGLQADFLLDAGQAETACGPKLETDGEGEAGAIGPTHGVVIECHYPSVDAHAALLGRAVMLQQVPGVAAVLLCVPYLSVLEPTACLVFARQQIAIVTPDTLLQALDQAFAAANEVAASAASEVSL